MKRIIPVVYLMMSMIVGLTGCMDKDGNQDEEKIVENETAIQAYIKTDSLGTKAAKDSSGLYYITRKTNPAGERAKKGDAASVKFTGYLLNGSKVLSSPGDSTYSFPAEGYWTGFAGLERAIFLMKTGEKTTFLLPYYLAFGNVERVNIPAYSPIRLEVEFLKTRTEVQQIDEYLLQKKFEVAERTAGNLVIVRTNTVTGDKLGTGKSVSVKYKGTFLNGNKFDEGTLNITTGTNNVIEGFDSAVQKMRKTEKTIVIFPSSLGYKATGYGSVPPFTPLQFELEVLP
ncbi:FKBP-type peptidyl-prolyl cis-trans isomerase [Dyadobacter sp. CY323]|uniref:FKBP-type peptidyl-prolyl cis-trans isomerase n=1 Tax=Dyadobacter sp. CY323 TaxID=2907302 RepID=UPI001F18B97A|nr:FKBP-type peptidyl-prolyl cis-trans isomerase [Dyadobacter sp. CY323]MCE6988838.1 FKBP-type peptidyl-prolyl cis-trans isomerase [Dyadobacter sp. CY323]